MVSQVWRNVGKWLAKQALNVVMKGADPQAAMNETICSHLSHAIDGTLLTSSLEDLPGGTDSVSCLLRTVLLHRVVALVECAEHGILGATHICVFSCPVVMSLSSARETFCQQHSNM